MPVTAKGLEGIVANSTRLSDVIGDKGQLIYSGYDINELAGKVSFKEVVYLLWKGKLPNRRRSIDSWSSCALSGSCRAG
jgi:Citrate synthase